MSPSSPKKPKRIAILGDGGWGTAMGLIQAETGHTVRLWGHDADYIATMQSQRENTRFLPGLRLPDNLALTADAADAVADADIVITAIPTIHLRPTLERLVAEADLAANIPAGAALLSLTKGVEQTTFARPSEIVTESLSRPDVAILSGPSHAEEVARHLPASVSLAAEDESRARALQKALITTTFRIYTATDVIGLELGGALKNVMAVAVGICEGLDLGDNARAALMTRGLAEMTRLAVALGAEERTFLGLGGVGDLITTCVSPHGRNRAFGLAIARGDSAETLLRDSQTIAEGVHTCRSARELARDRGVDMPITEALFSVLYEGRDARNAVGDLMNRSAKPE